MQLFLLDHFYSNSVKWMEQHMLTCPSKYFTHIDCPGCGLQRSYISLLKGDIAESLRLYPAAIPILFLIWFLVLHLINKYKKGANILAVLYIFCAIIIAVHYIYRVVTHQIF